MSQHEHKAAAPLAVRLFVLTVSDTRTEATDTGGAAIVSLATAAGHLVTGRMLVKDEPADVARAVTAALAREDVDAVITTGGTGLSARDTTYEAIAGLLDKRLDGFGELFRSLSYADIGPAAMLSRALAGTARGKFVASLPGSEGAVRLAMEKLLVPELAHIVQQLRRG